MMTVLGIVVALATPLQAVPPQTPPPMPIPAERLSELKTPAHVVGASRLADGSAAPAELVLPALENQSDVVEFVVDRYPSELRNRAGFTMPWAWVFIDRDGRTSQGRIVRTSGHAQLDSLALSALRIARFKPALLSGAPIGVWVPLPIQLPDRNPTEQAAQTAVPVHREPRHRLVWEAGPIRVLDVQLPPGDTTQYHIHDTAILYVPIETSTTVLGQRLGGQWSTALGADTARAQLHVPWSDTAYARQPLTHRVANVGKSLFRLIAVTNSKAPATLNPAAASSALPGNVELTSSWFRQTRINAAAGSTTAWYTSPLPVVIVQPTAGASIVEHGPASTTKELAGAGGWFFLPANVRFRVRNSGNDAVMLVFVQIR